MVKGTGLFLCFVCAFLVSLSCLRAQEAHTCFLIAVDCHRTRLRVKRISIKCKFKNQ